MNNKAENTKGLMLFLLYFFLVLLISSHHESWRDEAQAWLLSRDLSFFQLIKHISYEGTPALWHSILMPFAKSGFSYASINYINILIIAYAVFLFIRFSPFTLLTKTLFVFSYYMAWEYSIIARSYSLSVALIFSIAAFYQYRYRRPILYACLIAILFNTNVHGFIFSGSFVFLYLYDSTREKLLSRAFFIALSIISLGALLALLQLIPDHDSMYVWRVNIFAPFVAVMNAFFPVSSFLEQQLAHKLYLAPLAFIALLTLLYFSCFLKENYRHLFFFFIFVFAGLVSVFIFKNFGTYRHHGFIFITLIFVLWVSENYNQSKHVKSRAMGKYLSYLKIDFRKETAIRLLNIVLGFSIMSSAVMYYKEYNDSFSGSKKMAAYLIDTELEERLIVASSSQIMSSLLPYLPKTIFWYPDTQRFGTYIVWTHEYKNNRNLSFQEIERRAEAAGVLKASTLFLLSRPIPDAYLADYHLVNKVDEGIFGAQDEKYYLYEAVKK